MITENMDMLTNATKFGETPLWTIFFFFGGGGVGGILVCNTLYICKYYHRNSLPLTLRQGFRDRICTNANYNL